MLMKRAKAYGSFCSQVTLVYLYPFRRNSLFCSRKNGKKIIKNLYFRVQGHLRLSELIPLKSTCAKSFVRVMISHMSVPICNRFHDRQTNSRKITTF